MGVPARPLAHDDHRPLLVLETHSCFVNHVLPPTSTTGLLHTHRQSPPRASGVSDFKGNWNNFLLGNQ